MTTIDIDIDDDHNPIECTDCGTHVVLVETPYADGSDYVATCGCDGRGIDVSDEVNGNSLVEPLTGKWSNIDHDSRIGSGDPE